MEFQLLKDMVLILALAVAVLYIFHRLRIPSVIGFLITGVITGPNGLNLVSNREPLTIHLMELPHTGPTEVTLLVNKMSGP